MRHSFNVTSTNRMQKLVGKRIFSENCYANLHETYIQFNKGSFYVGIENFFCSETHKLSVCFDRIQTRSRRCNFISVLVRIQFSDRLNDILMYRSTKKEIFPSLNLPFIHLIFVWVHWKLSFLFSDLFSEKNTSNNILNWWRLEEIQRKPKNS